jgi:PST family polysaccharide transporter
MSTQRDEKRPGDATLRTRVTAAAAWMVAFRWTDRLIGLLSVAVLARILNPADFGIVGYAMLVIGLLDLFTGISTDVELIRHKLADRAYYNAAWTMNVLRGFAIGALMIALIQPAVDFFGEPRLATIMLALAAIPLIQGFENVGIVEFRKHLEFDREFRFLLAARLLGTLATLGLAFALRNYWALALGSILRTVFRVALSYWVHPFRPGLNLTRVPELFRFSRWMMLQNLASGVYEKLPGIVVGREWGSSALAFFNMGKEISDLSTTEIRAPIRRALYPGLAQITDRREQMSSVLVESTGMLALLTLPIPLGIALVANDLVPLFLGAQWQPMIGVLQPLCIAASFSALGTNSQLAYMALNRSHLAAVASLVRVLLLLVLLPVVAPPFGVVGVAYMVAGVSGAMVIADYALSSRVLKIGAGRFLAVIWRPVTAALAMCVAVWLFRAEFIPASDLPGHAWSLARTVLLGILVYAVCLLGLWLVGARRDGAEQRLIALVTNYRDRRA